jgi:hypothetical protein
MLGVKTFNAKVARDAKDAKETETMIATLAPSASLALKISRVFELLGVARCA